MPQIKILSNRAIALIAAGEVIERPFSVVKELVENSIDAEATKIKILIQRGGRNLISVSDNGKGIAKNELKLALQRHATSKLTNEDLNNISYLGFRGEALSSICAAAKVTMISRTHNSDIGWQINTNEYINFSYDYDNNKSNSINNLRNDLEIDLMPAAHGFGTSVLVQNLFFSTPNKLRFLKSEQSENSACIDLVQRLAIANYKCDFTLEIDNKKQYCYNTYNDNDFNIEKNLNNQLPSQEAKKLNVSRIHDDMNDENKLQKRLDCIFGEDFLKNAAKLYHQDEFITIKGYCSLPTFSKWKRGKHYIYVNGRFIKDDLVNIIVRTAYNNILHDKCHPTVIIFISINVELVDVNIHPAKTQVKFWQEQKVKNALFGTIRNALSKCVISESIVNTTCAKFSTFHDNNHQHDYMSDSNIIHDMSNTILGKNIYNESYEPHQAYRYNKTDYSTPFFKQITTENDNHENNSQILKQEIQGAYFQEAKPRAGFTSMMKSELLKSELLTSELLTSALSTVECTTAKSGSDSKLINTIQTGITPTISTFKQLPFDSQNETRYDQKLYPDIFGNAISQINATYIIAISKEALTILDQHAIHERLILEKIKQDINIKLCLTKRMLLKPEIIELSEINVEKINYSIIQGLDKFGIEIEPIGKNQIVIKSTPCILGSLNFQELITELLTNEDIYDLLMQSKIEKICGNIACHSSIKAGKKMEIHEMNNLLRQLENIDFASYCNHGRPTYVMLHIRDIAKIFDRK